MNHFCTRIKTAGTEQFDPNMSTCFNVFSDDGSSSFNIGIDTNLLKTWSFTSLHCLKIRLTNSLHFATIPLTWTVWAEVPDKIWNQPLRTRENLSPENGVQPKLQKSQISIKMRDPKGSQLFRVYMEDFFQIVLSRRCIGVGDFKIRNLQPNAFLLPAGSLCYDQMSGSWNQFQQTNRTSDPRNEKMWHNISSGGVSTEVAISLQHMKLTSGSESVSKQMTANFGRYRIK